MIKNRYLLKGIMEVVHKNSFARMRPFDSLCPEWKDSAKKIATDMIERYRGFLAPLMVGIGKRGECERCGAEVFFVRLKNGDVKAFTAEGMQHSFDCKKG